MHDMEYLIDIHANRLGECSFSEIENRFYPTRFCH